MVAKDESLEVSASEFKQAWHKFLEMVAQRRQEVIVTRYGRPIAKLSPYDGPGPTGGIFGSLAGCVTVHGDITDPIDEAWEADA